MIDIKYFKILRQQLTNNVTLKIACKTFYSMNYDRNSRLGLVGLAARNEGKLKSYGSTSDVRAWSHSLEARDRYLRDWIKHDMRICVISVTTLANLLKIMTYKNRGKSTPRCHPNCKSKVVLESICASCYAMKDCLKNDTNFEKYFEQEEFETCHWPCERCLDALKSIKMFWRIIVDKVFRIRVPKSDVPLHINSVGSDSVRSTATTWQHEMVQHAWAIRNLKLFDSEGAMKTGQCHRTKSVINPSISSRKVTVSDKPKSGHTMRSNLTKLRDDEPVPILVGNKIRKQRKCVHRYISVRIKTVDVGCDTSELPKENVESGAHVNNLNILQERYNALRIEMENLKRENTTLKFELRNLYDGFSLKYHSCTPAKFRPLDEDLSIVPKPFDCIDEIEEESPNHTMKNADSEMIITMKNCYNPNYKNVSLLQVLHKTNDPLSNNPVEPACRTEDPASLLLKMQNVFGAIVRREMSIVNDVNRSRTKIDASFHRVTVSRSVPSCSTLGCPSKTTMFYSTQT